MNVLVVGSGGREHALVWKIRQSPLVTHIFAAPGNPGIGEIAENVPLKSTDIEGLLKFALLRNVDLTVVGPEVPLTEGIVDRFESHRLKIFGPSKAAATIEGSKVFAKKFMKAHNIPTAEFRAFTLAQRFDAERYINESPVPLVIKADGLAAGKGVTVCETKEQALDVLRMMMEEKMFGEAGASVVIEEFLEGEEASILAITDGRNFIALPPAQDHKRILDDDQGKNTGGMGAYAPAPVITAELYDEIIRSIIRPTLNGLAVENRLYKGCLYAGVIITQTGPKVVEFNCRFGDPETQVILPLIADDLVPILLGVARGGLESATFNVKSQTAACVIIASGGYPGDFKTGKQIFGLEAAGATPNVLIFHAATKSDKERIVTAGGRVLGVTALGGGNDLEGTVDAAYRAVRKITFDDMYYRGDIGKKGILRLRQHASSVAQ